MPPVQVNGPPVSAECGLSFTVLGPLRAWRGTTPLDLGPVRQQAFLAGLLLRPDVTVSRQQLLDAVWGEEPPGTGLKVVPGYVYRVRKSLGGDSVISGDRGGYRFHGDRVRVDSVLLEELAAQARAAHRAGDLAAAVGLCAEALALFGGEPLTGLPGPFVAGQRRRWTERRIALAQQKAEWELRLGRHAEVVEELSALLAAHPDNETLAALLMRALHDGGRRADALAVYAELRHRLVEELGVEPGAETRRVQQAVLLGEDVAPRTPRATVQRGAARDELPADVGDLAGRDRELALLTASAGGGAVTVDAVDGVAGSGKTALAVTAARVLRAECSGGCLFVDLHGHSEVRDALAPQRVLRRLLRAVGVDDSAIPDDLDELAAGWRSATIPLRLLLILDDASSPEQVRPLLPAGAGSRVLVTSRGRLTGLDVRRRISLGPLDVDAAQGLLGGIVGTPSTDRERAAARELARLCGWLPLALRIAGARLQHRPMWTLEDLVSRLSDDDARLGELTAGDRSVEAAFRLSYHRIPGIEQRAFRALSRTPSAELDRVAMAAMLNCSPARAGQVLENLVDANLVQQPAVDRYRLHDLVAVFARRLAAEHPAETAAADLRLLELHLTAARRAVDWKRTGRPDEPWTRSTPFSGVRDAVEWLNSAGDLSDVVSHAVATGNVDHACLLAEAGVDYLLRRGRIHECRAALEIALEHLAEATERRMVAALRFWLGCVELIQGRHEPARSCFRDALHAARNIGDRWEESRALGALGVVAGLTGAKVEAVDALSEALEAAVELGDDWLVERADSYLGYLQHVDHRHDEALERFERIHALGEKLGSAAMMARALCYSGSVHLVVGRFSEAATALRQAVDSAEELGDLVLYAASLSRLGSAEYELGDPVGALDSQRRALKAFPADGPASVELEMHQRLAETCLRAGRHREAQEHFHSALALAELTGPTAEIAGLREVFL
ncbi:BTAD domain-containing putative transcriptional regulator [Saccharopolyspora sp. NFXS83]|uniref:AfsR/SARP family transcriptional regulator n=1 Tax=Saccharopolyspora sp. NFXS83 TaxID=2993560 RepID=UPI00224B35B8|nr:BTAD domain-containing putative transcriptional regulator [Saccharopolyspora sp. NFXS83]MCX2730185.1 BTAD domain-containing putative transcriptional regulator [Saccharopolyspora sp. NFXS83]